MLPPSAIPLEVVLYELNMRPSFFGKDYPVKVADIPFPTGLEGGKEGLLSSIARSSFYALNYCFYCFLNSSFFNSNYFLADIG